MVTIVVTKARKRTSIEVLKHQKLENYTESRRNLAFAQLPNAVYAR